MISQCFQSTPEFVDLSSSVYNFITLQVQPQWTGLVFGCHMALRWSETLWRGRGWGSLQGNQHFKLYVTLLVRLRISFYWLCSFAATCPNGLYSCRGGDGCLSWDVVCDGFEDCYDGSDEAGLCHAKLCSSAAAGKSGSKICQQICRETPVGAHCTCSWGYT